MGDILPFVARVRASGDWSASERARLEELAERFAAVAEGVEVVFGATDEGDPWCVVKDAYDEVIVHVARIGGRFVIHYALDDALKEGADLQAVLGERLHWEEDEREDVVVPFSRQAQSFIALLVAAAFYYETQHLETGGASETAASDHDLPEVAAHQAALSDYALLDLPHAKAAALALTADSLALPARSFAAAAGDPAPELQFGGRVAAGAGEAAPQAMSEGAVALVEPAHWSGEARPVALATFEGAPVRSFAPVQGTPAETYGAASSGGHDKSGPAVETLVGGNARQGVVEGSGGDDHMTMGPNVVARGGGGADTFVVQNPNVMGDAESRLGVIVDFKMAEGDRLVGMFGKAVAVTLVTTTAVAIPAGGSVSSTDGALVTVLGHRLDLDLNGDGRADGHLVLVDEAPAAKPLPAPAYDLTASMAHDPNAPIVLVGHSLDHYES